ncbi:unnamed protein product [Microthlaspi erraticum]|uniref:Glabrous enhancer-binding protein-like DBD domain-containing protein n=1 Tax=Microthlaspi erraticum TaxID=1685480 RepID=A0A6D2KEV1_9BRAS|nr:unnamed protein product [Microthlaspi erraticum]
MTNKRNPLQDQPTASSSDDDETESEEASSSDDEETKDPAAKPPSSAVTIAVPGKPTVSAAAAASESSDSESGSESETDSDSESNLPPTQASVKPLAVTTVPSAAKPKKKETEASAALPLPAAKSGAKRPSEGTSREANSKRAKKPTSGEEEKKIGEDSLKKPEKRVWTEDDEITILQGMIDFQADEGKSPYEDTAAYYNLTKGSISVEVSKSQFMDKIRSLRKKYMNKENPSFTKPHDLTCYKLSQHIWGSDGLALQSAVKSKTKKSKKSGQKVKKLDSVKPNGKPKAVEDDDSVAVKKADWFEKSGALLVMVLVSVM